MYDVSGTPNTDWAKGICGLSMLIKCKNCEYKISVYKLREDCQQSRLVKDRQKV